MLENILAFVKKNSLLNLWQNLLQEVLLHKDLGFRVQLD